MIRHDIDMGSQAIRQFCVKWRIKELSVFGSVLRDDFRPDSDVDFLVVFEDDADWGILELVDMEEELGSIVGRKVDLVERASVEKSPNYIRRKHILSTVERVYAQR